MRFISSSESTLRPSIRSAARAKMHNGSFSCQEPRLFCEKRKQLSVDFCCMFPLLHPHTTSKEQRDVAFMIHQLCKVCKWALANTDPKSAGAKFC